MYHLDVIVRCAKEGKYLIARRDGYMQSLSCLRTFIGAKQADACI